MTEHNQERFPLKMQPNRVWRIYLGGKLLDEFCGAEQGKDSYYPEDWLASLVQANNLPREGKPEKEGLSRTEDGDYLCDVLAKDPEGYFGARHLESLGQNLGILVKFLDSAERLPIQVHPDKQKAREFFCSDFGKTEAWYILGGREIDGEEPYILLGFKPGITRETWQSYFDAQDIDAMANSLHRIPVKPGEMYLVQGGTPHAIGSGVLLLEIQEPTDYTISVERQTPQGEVLNEYMLHQGIGFDRMMQCFHYQGMSESEILSNFKCEPVCLQQNDDVRVDSLIDYTRTKAFALKRIEVYGRYLHQSQESPSLLVAASGRATWSCGTNEGRLDRGEVLFLPANMQDFTVRCEGEKPLVMLECLPPKIELNKHGD